MSTGPGRHGIVGAWTERAHERSGPAGQLRPADPGAAGGGGGGQQAPLPAGSDVPPAAAAVAAGSDGTVAVAARPVASPAPMPRGRVVAGTALFVLGFSIVFVA